MDYLDIRIKELTSEAEEHLLRSSQPLGWLGLARRLFRGRLGWTVWANIATQIVAIVAGVWTAIEFFSATDVLTAVKFGLSSAVLILIAVQLKQSLIPHAQTERVLRALKRVEILILARDRKT